MFSATLAGWLARVIRSRRSRERYDSYDRSAATPQEDLAHASGITVTALVRIETAKANPTWSTIRKIAAGLGVSVGQVANLADQLAADE